MQSSQLPCSSTVSINPSEFTVKNTKHLMSKVG